MTDTEINYNRRIEMAPKKAYDEIIVWLDERQHHAKFKRNYSSRFFDEAGTQVVRTSRERRTIEISDTVGPEIVDTINRIIRDNIRIRRFS